MPTLKSDEIEERAAALMMSKRLFPSLQCISLSVRQKSSCNYENARVVEIASTGGVLTVFASRERAIMAQLEKIIMTGLAAISEAFLELATKGIREDF